MKKHTRPMSENLCPICEQPLLKSIGDAIHPGSVEHGMTLYCAHVPCEAQEVFGHGANERECMTIVLSKYKKDYGLAKKELTVTSPESNVEAI